MILSSPDFACRKFTDMRSTNGAYCNPCLHGPSTAVSHLLRRDGCQKTLVPQKRLSEILAELAEGTTIMGRPQRTERRYGVIGGHRNIVTTWPPVLTQRSSHHGMEEKNWRSYLAFQHSTPSFTAFTSRARPESINPNHVIPRRAREDSLPPLTKLYAFILSFDDENDPPPSVPDMKPGSALSRKDRFQRHLRTEHVPLAALQNFPVKRALVEQTCVMDRIEEYPGLSYKPATASLPKASKPKGWARLHPKAPPAINTTLANAAPEA